LRPVLGIDRTSPVLVVCGGADDLTGGELGRAQQMLGAAVPSAAAVCGATVVDGGTSSGVMGVTGAARARRPDALPVLLGVAPLGQISYPGGPAGDRVSLEPNHSHFVLAQSSEWGGETRLLIDLATALADGDPVVMVVAGGGSVATAEVLAAVRRGWPVFIIERTGGLADRLGSLRAAQQAVEDPELREIVETGDLRLIAGEGPEDLTRQLSWELQNEPVLKSAWQEFAACDHMASRLRTRFTCFQASILFLGVAATLLALIYNETHAQALHWLVVAAPVLVSVLIALAGRHAAGQRWVLLRAAAETIKAEIYRYRTRTPPYDGQAADKTAPRQQVLADRIDAIKDRLLQTEVSSGPLPAYDGPLPPEMYGAGPDDDGLSPLSPARYLSIRVDDQLAYYHGRVRSLSRRRWRLQLVAIAAGGTGALLAAAGFDLWVGLTGGVTAASLAYLGYLQVDNTIVTYNQSAARLAGLERWWLALSAGQHGPGAFQALVARAEEVLTGELAGWVQQMNDAMADLKNRESGPVGPAAAAADAGHPRQANR
jgi:hypothetical protein